MISKGLCDTDDWVSRVRVLMLICSDKSQYHGFYGDMD